MRARMPVRNMKYGRVPLALLLLCAIGCNWSDELAAQSTPVLGDSVVLDQDGLACKDVDELIGSRRLVNEGDEMAMIDYMGKHDCSFWSMGNKGIIRSNSTWPDTYCVRFQGQADCLWTFGKLFRALPRIGAPTLLK